LRVCQREIRKSGDSNGQHTHGGLVLSPFAQHHKTDREKHDGHDRTNTHGHDSKSTATKKGAWSLCPQPSEAKIGLFLLMLLFLSLFSSLLSLLSSSLCAGGAGKHNWGTPEDERTAPTALDAGVSATLQIDSSLSLSLTSPSFRQDPNYEDEDDK
jgi:hypothetical protein